MAQQQGQEQQKRPSIWEMGGFCSLLADPFVEGNSEVKEGSLPSCCAVMEFLIHESPRLASWKESPLMPLLQQCRELSSVQVDDTEKFGKYMDVFLAKLNQLPEGEQIFLPGGWVGQNSNASLVYIAERKSADKFDFVICNAGAGLNYHPCKVCDEDPTKIKYQTCFKLADIPRDRFLDAVFWSTLNSQWLKASEFHRAEVLYDVLFPWLSGAPTLADAIEKSQEGDNVEWRTKKRAGSTSAWSSLMEAIRYFAVTHYGCTVGDMKEFTTLLKCEMLGVALNDLNDEERDPPTSDEKTLIRMGCSTVAHAVLKRKGLDATKYQQVHQLIEQVEKKLVEKKRKKQNDTDDEQAMKDEEEEEEKGTDPFPEPFEAKSLAQRNSPFPRLETNEKDTEKYAGLAEEPKVSHVSDFLQVTTKSVNTVEQAVAALVRCEAVCKELNDRSRDGSSFSSRIAIQYQIASLIRMLFTTVLPLPIPPSNRNSAEKCIWKKFPSKELELTCLTVIHRLTMIYAVAWQSFDAPSRGFDSERAVVALCMVSIFECVLRHDSFGLEVAHIMNEEGGFALSTSVCVANIPLTRLASTMELHLPYLAVAREKCLAYLDDIQSKCKYKDLFTFRMPTDKIEIKKYGSSVLFLRKVMERYGYELVPRNNPQPPPEIESLMEWMCSDSSQLAREHPEFTMLRDMACLFKFLATMESRESELQRQRIAPNEYVSWGLSFEDTSMEVGTYHARRSLLGRGLKWEVLNYRGVDLDTADVEVTGFGDRKIYFGEGLVVHSPCDVTALLNFPSNQRPSEDDILHADSLPTFGDTLSRQEAEMLLSYLTVPYLRIPLVLAFFATGDRVTYLFSAELQALLRAVLFDAADWVPRTHEDKIETVPASSSGFRSSLDHIVKHKEEKIVLGTPDGLLLNELRHAPESTLRPLMKMLKSINDLAEASVYSPDAALSLYLIELALDVQSFLEYVDMSEQQHRAEMNEYLVNTCRPILKKWLREALAGNDIETSCMIHSYLSLIWSNMKPDQMDTTSVSEMLGSLCFVRNWHGFGLGEPVSMGAGDPSSPPEQRLLRFMQAHGVDISRIAKGSLQKYVGQTRPLYLRIGAKTVRVPNLHGSTENEKKRLIANVPEQKLFSMLQQQRFALVGFLVQLLDTSPAILSETLTKIVRIALDTKGTSLDATDEDLMDAGAGHWTMETRGKFLSPDKEMTLDIQGAQIMWRNDELKPLPDSMTHFNDFHAIFGKQQLHCGVVAQQQHRNWVHVVGTQYDLLLWDEPEDKDQGVDCPEDVSEASGGGGDGGDNQDSLFWACQMCTFTNESNGNPNQVCGMCNTPRQGGGGAQQQQQQQQGGDGEEQEDKSPTAIRYKGVLYDRHLDPFSEDSLKSFTDEDEHWVLKMLVPALRGHYKDKMPFRVLLPHDKIERDCKHAVAMAGHRTELEIERETPRQPQRGGMFSMMMQQPQVDKVLTTTWKEFVMFRERQVLQVFNMVSHGRKLYRKLVFCSESKFGFHALDPSRSLFGACGDLKGILQPEQSLVITRNRDGFIETYLPSRLLFGVVPSALLEAYQFWHGSDGIIRGEPMDLESTWFGNKQIHILKDRTIIQKPYSKRKSMGVMRSVLAGKAASLQRRLVVASSRSSAASMASEQEFDQNDVLSLCALGFTPAAARLALSKCDGSSTMAAEWLFDPSHAAQIENADDIIQENRDYRVVGHGTVKVRSAPTEDDDHGYVSNQIATLGFGQVVRALERSGSWLRILNERQPTKEAWVLAFHPERGTILEPVGESNADDDASKMDGAAAAAAQAAVKKIEAKKAAAITSSMMEVDLDEADEDEDSNNLRLINLLDHPKKDEDLYALLTILTNIEDLSHILVWGDPSSGEAVLVELPRLKLRIKPEKGRLMLSDQAGWFICLTNARFKRLLDCHSLLLMNGQKEVQFLVPNHEASRPTLKGCPFSTKILCDRGSFAWLQTMDTRYYLYRIHTSCTFLISQELSASLYLVHLMLLKRQYETAFQLAPTCTVDVPFAPDEGFIWGQLERSLGDRHPDAHAVRLKLSLAVMYAREHIRLPWEVHAEYDSYLEKLPRVSAACRLTHNEELKVCKLTSSGTPLIKNRLTMLTNKPLTSIELKAPAPRVGGSPWNKIQSQTSEYYNNHGTTLKRIHFKPQVGSGSFDTYMCDVIFSEHVLCDEESGVNRQLGFAFLYQILTSNNVPGAATKPRSVGEILSRYLHLKLSRWGRETVSQGEVEASNSRHMAQLACLMKFPQSPWPKLPTDTDSIQLLRNGINLYTERGRQSEVKLWLDMVDLQFQELWPQVVAGNADARRFLQPFLLKDIPNSLEHQIQPARASNTRCAVRKVLNDTVGQMMEHPLEKLNSFIRHELRSVNESGSSPPHEKLPFDLYGHSAAQPAVAREILTRLEEDVKGYAHKQKTTKVPVLQKCDEDLIAQLEALIQDDAVFIRDTIHSMTEMANRLKEDPECKLALKRRAKLNDMIDFSLLTQALLCDDAKSDLRRINPTLSDADVDELLNETIVVLVRTNRISHASRSVNLARTLMKAERNSFRGKQIENALAESLATCRYYVEEGGQFDPRYLVFEYVFDIILRERQVEIVRSFADDVAKGESHVQQMIMGAGKTTVVAPLLTLLLADGDTLVTQVMPTALLEQTRHIMRTRFGAIITKRVFTLEFDRGCEDSPDVARAVFEKLEEARTSGSVVCASPDAVKSLFLKFVEQLHSLESVDPEVLFPSTSIRQNKEIVQLRDVMQSRSDMSDSLVPIFDMWNDGVLIMDEVDVLLHPLRSELNFPIGLKDPIDMAGFRWDLPIYLLGAFFKEAWDLDHKSKEEHDLLMEIDHIVEEGYHCHSLQRNPHLVLLDEMFYKEKLMRPAAQMCIEWIKKNTHDLPSNDSVLIDYLICEELEGDAMVKAFGERSGVNMKLLNLARDWIRVLLPHVLSKIDRVSFGILSEIDLSNIDQKRTPLSRKLMAVPFVGKDVPSRSSEFAHPDVVIGLSILGYRYEGLRLRDVRTIVTQLKADFSRQVGPRDQRPASKLFREWLEHASKDTGEQLPVLPLPLFQVNDPKQLQRLFQLLRKEDRVITYYLRQHVFPACMNFQSIKISACGHELGSSMLFKKRIGFSGTPSNLLPSDLGQCLYEPGSDGKIIHVLSSPDVVTVQRKEEWTAKSLLRDVATSTSPVFHALIDTGALITGMDNEQVARYLLDYLPPSRFEGVVYLDRADRKMFLQRSSGKSLHLSQCGVDPSRRFTFYDQVHTTGMDIKQAPDAIAVVTIGKDMTFRDYAQGSFRMRGIGNGQTIHLYLIPEVEQLMKKELYSNHQGNNKDVKVKALDVPAWLLINSMKMETIQYSMLSLQELYNCWRKESLGSLVSDCKIHSPSIPGASKPVKASERLRRFLLKDADESQSSWLRQCVQLFREPVGFVVPDRIPTQKPFHEKVIHLIEENQHFCKDKKTVEHIESIAERVRYTKDLKSEELEAEIVNENEQEQQQEQEEEAEEEQEKISRYTRDDEQANPWTVSHLNNEPNPSSSNGDQPFYRMSEFAVRESQPRLSFPDCLYLSDNWFRPRWIGLGDRRLKNVMVVLEWIPKSFTNKLTKLIPLLHQYFVHEKGLDPNTAALKALTTATAPRSTAEFEVRKRFSEQVRTPPNTGNDSLSRIYVTISLAEAETLRRILHTSQTVLTSDYALLTIEDGSQIDGSKAAALTTSESSKEKSLALSCLRFVNCDMYYTDDELDALEEAFRGSPIRDRIQFFEDCLRLRRREKHLWGDTPLAKFFTDKSEWHLLDSRAKLQQLSMAILRILKKKNNKVDIMGLFAKADVDGDNALTHAELQRFLEDLRLGFSPADIAMVIQLIDQQGDDAQHAKITWDQFTTAFNLPEDVIAQAMAKDDDMEVDQKNARWQCSNCTYAWNFASEVACEICGYGWDGSFRVPNDKWMCDPQYGGCTFFNSETSFYCEVCNKSKPSLQSVRF